MKLSVLQENLGESLASILRVVSSRPQLPVLQNVLLDARRDGLYIEGTDLEVGMSVRVDAKIEEVGKITVPARMFSEFVTSIPAGKVEMLLDKDSLRVGSGAYKAVFQTIAADEFPNIPDYKGNGGVKFVKSDFSNALEKVLFATAKDSMRPVLTGVFFEFGKKKLKLVATDGFRLALQDLRYEGDGLKSSVILPARAVAEVMKVSGDEVKMKLLKESNQVVFRSSDVVLVAQLLDGSFPDYKKIMPSDYETEVVFSREELLQAIKVSQVFARDNSNVIGWKVEGSVLTVKAESPEQGENTVLVEGEVKGEGGEITFNGKFLMDMLTVVSFERIWFGMGDSLAPGSFRGDGEEGFWYIVMPINI